MKIFKLTTILTAIIITMSACSPEKTYTEQEYNSVISEKDNIALERDVLLAEVENLKYAILIAEAEENAAAATAVKQTEAVPAVTEALPIPQDEPVAKAGQVETERKFLLDVNNLPTESMKIATIYDFTQTYISFSPEMRVRARTGHKNDFYMTIKTPLDDKGLSRQEIEFFITEDEYNELVKKHVGTTIHKTRYQFWEENHYISIDVYSGELEGLAVSEIEFKSVEDADAYTPPAWFGKDITSDLRYKNANLAKDGMPK